MQKIIGIFGGTFNPVHLGHLHVAQELLHKMPLDEIRFLPCHTPVHRSLPGISIEHRVKMLKLALADQPKMLLDLHEINRAGPSYMIDTLRELRSEDPSVVLCLIIGNDAFAGLDEWQNWQQLADYCHLIVVNRPGYQFDQKSVVAEFAQPRIITNPSQLSQSQSGKILNVSIEPSTVSGSNFRHNMRQGKDLAGMVPNSVWEYIQKHHLYESDS